VVKTAAEDSKGNSPQGDVQDNPGFGSSSDQAGIANPQGQTNSQQDEQRVGIHLEVQAKPLEAKITQPLPNIEGAPCGVRAWNTVEIHHYLS